MANCVLCSTEVRDDARFCPSCGAEQPKSAEVLESEDTFIGQTVARNFKIEKLLGVGGMGKVYKARQLSLDKAVVIKILHDQFRDDPQLVQRFQREARSASRLNHPNSIQVIDFGQDDNGVLYMAIEFLEGEDLFAVLKRDGPFGEERIARIMMQVCSALAEAHVQHVIHRDLKPENIMIEDRRGQKDYVKVLDFGIAKIQDPDDNSQALTQAGMVCGTPEYMSPEQARGLELDSRADLYSLGVLTYQIATGQLPFTAESPIGIVTKHILEPPPPPKSKNPNVTDRLNDLILKAMAKSADDRFQTAVEMGEAFEELLRSPSAKPTSSAAAPSVVVPPAHDPLAKKADPVVQTTTGALAELEQRPATHIEAPVVTAGGGGMKFAALGLIALVVVGLGAAYLLKDTLFGKKGGGADAGVVVVAGEGEGEVKPDDAELAKKRAELTARASAAYNVEDLPEAIAAQKEIIALFPDDALAQKQLAVWQRELEAQKKSPGLSPEAKLRAKIKRLTRQMKAAIKKKKFKSALALAKQIKAADAKADIDDTIASIEKSLAGGSKKGNRAKAKALYAEGQRLQAKGFTDKRNLQRAFEKFQAAMKADPSFAEPLQGMAFVFKRSGKREQACKAINAYIRKAHLSSSKAASRRSALGCS